jgi:DnaJ-class molecular chaperone
MCHSAPGLSKTIDGKTVSLHVEAGEFRASVHAKKACVECHVDFRGQGFPHKQSAAPVQCSRCHYIGNVAGAPNLTPMKEYADSVHGRAVQRGDPDAPKCKDCHGTHGTRAASDPESSVYRANIADTCGECHLDSKMAERHHIPGPAKVRLYKNSVHGKAVRTQGLMAAAVCTDCHGVHNIRAARELRSTVNKPHVPETCGQCHRELYRVYKESFHGKALAQGIKDAPACTDCHGEHTIQRPSEPASSVYPTHVVTTCSKCHEDVKIERRYGLPANRLSTYIDSYHGVANKYGDVTVANCATCHGAHDIRPSADPKSAIHRKNLPKTCGKCHPRAGANFAKGSIHVFPTKHQDRGVYWVRQFYTGFIFLLIASFCCYIALDLFARWRGRFRRKDRGDC